jgi:leucyl-tRNA synthetase
MAYEHQKIEQTWQRYWEKNKTFQVSNDSDCPKYYVLDMFPYPSASGLHVGHLEGYTASDIVARYKRMQGFHVLHPMGWDSFGLPTENYAIQVKRHPESITLENIEQFKKQIQAMGFSYDWSREIMTSHPNYYKWTQWLFVKLYEKGLAYEAEIMVNYCPALKTVLANEEVIDGKSERGRHPVVRKPMKQWVLRITQYAERLLEDLNLLDWADHVKEMQRNWIGKSYGAKIIFNVPDKSLPIEVFTTRPDTLMGCTYMALSPEHPWVDAYLNTLSDNDEISLSLKNMVSTSERDRASGKKSKEGIKLPFMAIHPLTQKEIPIFVANYVLMDYGTGAIMCVPAHDERDHAFAERYKIPIAEVIDEKNTLINSGEFNGISSEDAKKKIVQKLQSQNKGHAEVRYKLRDWIFSRQRYWGEPIPILHFEDGSKRPLASDELPLLLPEVDSYEPAGDGKSPLSSITDWVNTEDSKTKKNAKRETNTMPQWAGSCWYYLRFLDPQNENAPWDKQIEKFWMPVDLYIGGLEHATLHLLYARFWHKVFFDIGMVSTPEPFQKLINQGMILGEDNEKMSKSRGNVVNPDKLVEEFGADSIRLFEMFLGPIDQVKPWNAKGIVGVYRFLNRVHTLLESKGPVKLNQDKPSPDELNRLHGCIKKVTEDTEKNKFNTAISEMMTFVNFAYDQKKITQSSLEIFLHLLCPYAPHLSEELWTSLGNNTCLSLAPWPSFDPKYLQIKQTTLAIQVNGKLKGTVDVPLNLSKEDTLKAVRQDGKLSKLLLSPNVIKTIVVPNKIVNIVSR